MDRYTAYAGVYDVLSGEPVYRLGRRRAVAALGLGPGDRVLDLGCGSGLSLPLLVDAVGREAGSEGGSEGEVVGVDASAAMLRVAGSKAGRHGWASVRLVQTDAAQLDAVAEPGTLDALVAVYALSLMDDPAAVWAAARPLLRPGARVAVVDLARPTGRARWATPLARLACRVGGSDIEAAPWRHVEPDLRDVRAWSLVGGHVQVRVGTVG